MDFALTLSQSRALDPAVLREVWSYGKSPYYRDHLYYHSSHRDVFWKILVRLDSDEVREELWKASQDYSHSMDRRLDAIPALALLEPDAAFEIAARHLREPGSDRSDFVRLLLKLDSERAVSMLIEQAARERQTAVLWTIARSLRRAGPEVEQEIRAKLESPDFQVRRAAVHIAGWQGPGFLESDLQRMASEDPDDDVQEECLAALDRQNKERCVLELMDAFHRAEGTTVRWSYLESILALGDPRLLTTEDDPLSLGRILAEESGALEVHANWRLKERFEEVKRSAEQRDRSQED